MPTIQVKDKTFVPYLNEQEIQEAVTRIGQEINKNYDGLQPLFIGILNGAFMFAADLFKAVHIDAEISFIKLVSYKGTRSTGNVITSVGLDESVKGRHVIIIEDIVDTGKTLHSFLPQLIDQQPASLKIASLLYKPDASIHPIKPDYIGFSIPNKFVLGYGLDYDGLARNLSAIYQLKDS